MSLNTEQIRAMDVTLDAKSSCNNRKINACCEEAIEKRVSELGQACGRGVLAKLEVSCPGYDSILGCQAHIRGELYDAAGETIPGSIFDDTIQELIDRHNLHGQE